MGIAPADTNMMNDAITRAYKINFKSSCCASTSKGSFCASTSKGPAAPGSKEAPAAPGYPPTMAVYLTKTNTHTLIN